MIRKFFFVFISSIFLYGCWFTSKKQSTQLADRPPLPTYKNNITVQVADFINESDAKHVDYLSKTVVPYLKEYLTQIKRIRFDEKDRIIANAPSIRNYFENKYQNNEKNAGIIFDILNKHDIPEMFLSEKFLQKRKKIKLKLQEKKEQEEKLKNYREFLVKKFSESSSAQEINNKIQEITKEINEQIKKAEAEGRPYSAKDKEKLLNSDPRIIALQKTLKSKAYQMGGMPSETQQSKKENLINYDSPFKSLSFFKSDSIPDSYYIKKSMEINKSVIEKNKNLDFLGINIFDFEKKSSLTVQIKVLEKKLELENFSFEDPLLAGASLNNTTADIVIAGKYSLEEEKINVKITGFERNSTRFIFNVNNKFSLQDFELSLQKYVKMISKDILNSLSNVETNPLIVYTNVDLGIVYLNKEDVGRTNKTERGQEYAELLIPAVPVGFNFLEVVKKGYFKENGYVFINPDNKTYSVDITMKELESEISLKIITEPKDAFVSVNLDIIKGDTKIAKNLNRGFHRVTVSAPGYETKVISVEVFPAIKNIVEVKLNKINKSELSPEELSRRYNFWKNFFFLGSLPLLGGMLYTQVVMDYHFNKANDAYNYAATLTGPKQIYWERVYTKSDLLYRTYVGHNNFFRISFGSAIILAGIFQYLESDAMDKDDIGSIKPPTIIVDNYRGNWGIIYDFKF